MAIPGTLTRRNALRLTAATGLTACAHTSPSKERSARKPVILLRSAWQTENIGDIAHTPGALALLREHIPEAGVILWPNAVDQGVARMLRKNFPALEIAHGELDEAGRPVENAVREAFARADLFLHGSGSGLPGGSQLKAWAQLTGKPYGFYGVSLWGLGPESLRLVGGARFVFCRDSVSVRYLKEQKPALTPTIDFGPDAAFAIDVRDEARAQTFLNEHGLDAKKFLCVVPRLRQTPYHLMRAMDWSDVEIDKREAVNQQFAEADHAKLRAVMVAWVRRTGGKVLVCPEMTYQLGIARPLLVDPLPEDVRPQVVVRRRYWLPDEAASTYARAAAVLSLEMHSPIIALANGTPAFYVRQPTDTVKGQMWRDIGLGDWMFEVDESSGDAMAEAALQVVAQPAAAAERARLALATARGHQARASRVIRQALGLG